MTMVQDDREVGLINSDKRGCLLIAKIGGANGGELKLYSDRIEHIQKGKKTIYTIRYLTKIKRKASNLNITYEGCRRGGDSFPMASKGAVNIWVNILDKIRNPDSTVKSAKNMQAVLPASREDKQGAEALRPYNYYSIEYADTLDGIPFEHYFAEILKFNNFRNIQVTTGSNDHSIDIIAWKGNRKCAIQCKRWKNKVSNDVVQKTFSGMKYWGAGDAIIVTTSGFTKSAILEANELRVILWERSDIEEMIANARELCDASDQKIVSNSSDGECVKASEEGKRLVGQKKRFCRFCGACLSLEARFCGKCGKNIELK